MFACNNKSTNELRIFINIKLKIYIILYNFIKTYDLLIIRIRYAKTLKNNIIVVNLYVMNSILIFIFYYVFP